MIFESLGATGCGARPGVRVAVSNTIRMSKKSVEILSKENQLKRLKARARLNAKKFKIEDVVEMYLSVYKKTLKST